MAHEFLPKVWGDEKGNDIFSTLQKEIDRIFHDFNGRSAGPLAMAGGDNGKVIPRMDISENDAGLEVTAELPGVEEADIDVSLTDEMLTVKGEKRSESEREEKDLRVVERSYGSFARSVRLPYPVREEDVNAQFKNGVLKITLPKSAEAASKTKKISVKAE